MNRFEFKIGPAVVKEVGLPILENHLQQLVSLFREHSQRVVPREILHPPQAYNLIQLSKKLEAVENCQGFEQHLGLYRHRPESALFAASLAGLFVSRGAIVAFEPPTTNRHRADLAVTLDDEEVVIECKAPTENALNKIRSEHERMFEVLAKYVEYHYHIRIKYRRTLTSDELEELGRILKDRLPHVREDGVIFASPEIEASVYRSVGRMPKGFHLVVVMSGPEPPDNVVLPGHAILRDGKNLAFNGPVIDLDRLLQDRIRKARKQAPLDKPYVVAISRAHLLGSPRSHLIAVQSEFTPKKYRHITGVLFVEFRWYIGGNEEARMEYVPNSFAYFPLAKKFQDVLRSA